jgi:hypothetical protein
MGRGILVHQRGMVTTMIGRREATDKQHREKTMLVLKSEESLISRTHKLVSNLCLQLLIEKVSATQVVGEGIKKTPAYETPLTKHELEKWRKEFWGKYQPNQFLSKQLHLKHLSLKTL